MPELRKDPVTGRWVIIATERAKRPVDFAATHDPEAPADQCPFCEGAEAKTPPEIFAVRPASGSANGRGWQVRVVPSIKPVLRIEGQIERKGHGLYDWMSGVGAHEILIETPHHVANLADVEESQIALVLQAGRARLQDLEKDGRFKYVLWFKNFGRAAGAGRVRHARSQLIATPVTPKRVKEELLGAKFYYDHHERCLYCDMISQELDEGTRVVQETPHVIVLAPFASRFPFELVILPKRHHCDFGAITPEELADLAAVWKSVLSKLKHTLADPPYNCILHTAPFRRAKHKGTYWKTIEEDYHWHFEIMPRLTRVAGFEWGSGFYINPTPPEEAAQYLRQTEESGVRATS